MVAVLSLFALGVAAPLLVQASPPPIRHSYTDYLADKPSQAPFGTSQEPENVRSYGHHPSHKDAQPNFSTVGGIPWDPRQDLGTTYNGLRTFSHAQPLRCTGADNATLFDVAVLGAPFDTATSYRPGARFGPGGIRGGSQRIGGMNRLLNINPFVELDVVDCGDVKMTFYDSATALQSFEDAYTTIIQRTTSSSEAFKTKGKSIALDGGFHPRVLTLGGDHTLVLPIMRSLYSVYGPLTVIHFDSHCDSRHPGGDPLTHGDYFYFAWEEGLFNPNTSIHAGIRVPCDYETDAKVGFTTVVADEIEDIGYQGVIDRILERVGDNPVILTFDIDTLDPAFAPATGTPEIGGWTTREVKKILHGLKDLRIIAADVVEVAPAYDDQAEITQIAGAGIAWELLSLMALQPLVQRPCTAQ